MFDLNKINKIIYFDCPDPGRKSEEFDKITLDKYKIELVKKPFLPQKTQYIEYVKDCDVFISPRKQEGIGMGFLEAISMGKYIVSSDDSTMNEYITDKKIGFLINKNEKLIDNNDVVNNVNYRIQFAHNGYLQWCKQKNEIMDFFLSNLNVGNKNWFTEILFFLDFIKFYIKKIFKYH